MKKFASNTLPLLALSALLLAGCSNGDPLRQAENPDPNHTHADFAIYISGEKVNFELDQYMSGLPADSEEGHEHDEASEYLHNYLHLHDNVGHVIHRHKPGQSLKDFLESLNFPIEDDDQWRMFVNGEEMPLDLDYVFADLDSILLTYDASDEEVQSQLEQMTNDACLYSRTCPQRGDPPAENCISDPAVPCVVPEEDL